MNLFGPMYLAKGEDIISSRLIANANLVHLVGALPQFSVLLFEAAQHVTCISYFLKI